MTAYFTDPMGDEFKKAMEEALQEMEAEESKKKRSAQSPKRNKRPKLLSRKDKESLK